jgi:hypothetical protein
MLSADIIGALSGLVAARLPDFSVELLERAGLPRFGSDPDLSAQLKNVIDNNSVILKDRQLGFAIVDLTDDPARGFGLNNPVYAGVNDTQYGTVASLAKLLPLYGAYQLRYDLRNYIKVSSIPDIATLANQVREGYRIINAAENNQNIPLIENIFFPASLGPTLDFWRGTEDDTALNAINSADESTGPRRARTWGKLRNTDNLVRELDPLFGTPPAPQALYFFQQLRLMAGWSDDISAAIVIEALGFPYLWKLADRSFLFRNIWGPIGTGNPDGLNREGDRGGLFLAVDYWHTSWATRRSGWSPPPEETPPHSGGDQDPVNGGTARSVALLMTALAQNLLIGNGATDFDPDAHHEIREILRKKFIDINGNGDPVNPGEHERGEVSPIGAKFRKQAGSLGWTISQTPWTPGGTPPTELAVSKIGLLDPDVNPPGHASNAILVRAGRGGAVPITAVLVGINRRDDSYEPLFTFGQEMVQVLAARHSA